MSSGPRAGVPARARRGRLAVLLGALVLVLLTLLPSSPAAAQTIPAPDPETGRVIVISAPHLTWRRFRESPTPALASLFERSALASLSVKTASSEPGASAAYLTLGSGNRAIGDDETERDGVVLGRDETWNGETGSQVFRRLAGFESDAPLLAVNVPRLQSANDAERYGAQVGALGRTLSEAGRSVAVIGNAAQTRDDVTRRHAGLFGVDNEGQLAAGAVGAVLLEPKAEAPFGLQYQLDAVVDAIDVELARSDVLLVELSDLARAEAERPNTSIERGDELYAEALRHDDQIVAAILDRIDLAHDTVMVVGPTPPALDEQLTVFAVAGAGATRGWATSSTTRRSRYVTLADVAPAILRRFDLTPPEGMEATTISAESSSERAGARIDALVRASDRAELRDETFGPAAVVFVALIAIDLGLAILCLSRYPRLTGPVTALSLWILSVPLVGFLSGLSPLERLTPIWLGTLIFGSALLVGLAVGRAARATPRLAPLAIIVALWVVIAVDVCFGGRLQIDTIFGYSPVVAGRFAGFGNQAFSFFGIAALAAVTGAYDFVGPTDEGRAPRWFIAAASAFFAVCIVLDGAPDLGSDVGGVLALTPAAVLAVLLIARVRIRARVVVASLLGSIGVLAVFTLLDLAREPDDRTHLGRFASTAMSSGVGQILKRKIATNLDVFTEIWAWIIPAALVYFAYITWRPNRTIVLVNANHWGYRAFGVAGLALGVGAMVFNDSGVSMPAVMLAVALPWSTFLAVDLESRRRRGLDVVADPPRARNVA